MELIAIHSLLQLSEVGIEKQVFIATKIFFPHPKQVELGIKVKYSDDELFSLLNNAPQVVFEHSKIIDIDTHPSKVAKKGGLDIRDFHLYAAIPKNESVVTGEVIEATPALIGELSRSFSPKISVEGFLNYYDIKYGKTNLYYEIFNEKLKLTISGQEFFISTNSKSISINEIVELNDLTKKYIEAHKKINLSRYSLVQFNEHLALELSKKHKLKGNNQHG